MGKMSDFFSSDGQNPSRVKRSAALSEGKSKTEKRNIEQAMLKPEPIVAYVGREPGTFSDVESRKITFVVPNDRYVDVIKKHFKVSSYMGLNIRNVEKIIAFLDALEEGVLRYDNNEEALYFVNEIGEEARLS